MKKVYFIRHGESTANISKIRLEDEPELTKEGLLQARQVANFLLKYTNIEKIYSSPMKRARQTAQEISKITQKSIEILDFVKERSYPSIVVGLHKQSSLAKEYYKTYKATWGYDKEFSKGGESFDDFVKRVKKTIYFIEHAKEQEFAIVSHGFFIKAIVSYVLNNKNLSSEEINKFYDNTKLNNTGIVELKFDEDTGDWKIISFNTKQHTENKKQISTITKKPKIITIGGGTGQYTILSGLKKKDVDIVSVVSTADSGGTTGILRDELGVLPPTDFRKNLVALSESEQITRELFMYRFANKNLQGHTVGNLIITALEKLTGSFEKAMKESSKIFNIKGKVLPVSDSAMDLMIELNSGEILSGEDKLDDNPKIREVGVRKVFLKNKVKLNESVKKEIKKADLIVIGPGDFYGSILPNFLVDGLSDAIANSSATKVFVANLTNKKGQTTNFTACDYVNLLHKYTQEKFIDILICNTEKIPEELIKKYEKQEGKGATVLCANPCRGYEVIRANLLHKQKIKTQEGDTLANTRSFIRHDPDKLADIIFDLANRFTVS